MKIGKLYVYVGTTKRKKVTQRAKESYPIEKKLRKEVLSKRGEICEYCGNVGLVSMHHIIPVYCGGGNYESNVLLLCNDCHHKMHNNPYFAIRALTRLGKFEQLNELKMKL